MAQEGSGLRGQQELPPLWLQLLLRFGNKMGENQCRADSPQAPHSWWDGFTQVRLLSYSWNPIQVRKWCCLEPFLCQGVLLSAGGCDCHPRRVPSSLSSLQGRAAPFQFPIL